MNKKEYNRIIKIVDSFPRKYQYGFKTDEINELLKEFPKIDIDKFNDATSHISAMCVDNHILIYPHDILKGIFCGIEKRDIKLEEFD
jgi:hypothetical protein